MTVSEMIYILKTMDPEKCIIISESKETDKEGWANIEVITEHQCSVYITPEKYPVFSDN